MTLDNVSGSSRRGCSSSSFVCAQVILVVHRCVAIDRRLRPGLFADVAGDNRSFVECCCSSCCCCCCMPASLELSRRLFDSFVLCAGESEADDDDDDERELELEADSDGLRLERPCV